MSSSTTSASSALGGLSNHGIASPSRSTARSRAVGVGVGVGTGVPVQVVAVVGLGSLRDTPVADGSVGVPAAVGDVPWSAHDISNTALTAAISHIPNQEQACPLLTDVPCRGFRVCPFVSWRLSRIVIPTCADVQRNVRLGQYPRHRRCAADAPQRWALPVCDGRVHRPVQSRAPRQSV